LSAWRCSRLGQCACSHGGFLSSPQDQILNVELARFFPFLSPPGGLRRSKRFPGGTVYRTYWGRSIFLLFVHRLFSLPFDPVDAEVPSVPVLTSLSPGLFVLDHPLVSRRFRVSSPFLPLQPQDSSKSETPDAVFFPQGAVCAARFSQTYLFFPFVRYKQRRRSQHPPQCSFPPLQQRPLLASGFLGLFLSFPPNYLIFFFR